MIESAQLCISLLAVVAAVVLLARRLKIPGPILMVPTGLALGLIPGLPHLRLDPSFALMLFLPPLVFAAAAQTSWPDFRANLRPIGLLAVGCVLFTTAAVAVTAHYLIGMKWALACVLGAVVSPPDAVAATSIAGRLTIPQRIVTILEGEGMVNDATALIVYRFATAAVIYGSFSIWQASGTFLLVIVGETIWGVAVGFASTYIRRWADDAHVEITLSLLTPFAAYWPVEHLGGSGVLATVAAGLWVSWNGPTFISSNARLQGWFFWDLMIFLVEGLLFLLTGEQFRDVVKSDLGAYSLFQLSEYAAAICAVVVIVRFVWVYPATYLPRFIPAVGRGDSPPPWQLPTVIAFAGMRGGISLAAALALPFTLEGGQPFPQRDLIIFLTFAVILVTLVGQGLTLPAVIRLLGVHHRGKAESEAETRRELDARLEIFNNASTHLRRVIDEQNLPPHVVDYIQTRHDGKLYHLQPGQGGKLSDGNIVEKIERELMLAERRKLYDLLYQGKISDVTRRTIEHELDLQEARMAR